jgi:transposase
MRFAPVKSVEQQAVLGLHRIRSAVVAERTAQPNQLRGLIAEFGLIMPKGRYPAQQHMPDMLEDAANGLPAWRAGHNGIRKRGAFSRRRHERFVEHEPAAG